MGSATALAAEDRTEVLGIGNVTTDDSSYLSFSVRHAFHGSLTDGAKFRFDLNRSAFDFDAGGIATTGEIVTAKLLVGTSWQNGNTNVTGYVGLSFEERSFSPAAAGIADSSTSGVFASAELSHNFNSGANLFGLAEVDSVTNKLYVSSYYVHPLGDRFKIGPTANYITETGYERTALGLRASYDITPKAQLTATGLWAEGGAPGGPKTSFEIFELQIRGVF